MKRGFTIVEMLMVVAVLAVLTGLVTTAASAAMRNARGKRAEAMKHALQAGIATYYAQKDYWPPRGGKLESLAKGSDGSGKNIVYLADGEYDQVLAEIAKTSAGQQGGNPMVDLTGMTVANKSSANRKNGTGQDYRNAVKKNKAHGKTISLSDMVFGYSDSKTGYFRRFVIQYNIASDSVVVLTQDEYKKLEDKPWDGSGN